MEYYLKIDSNQVAGNVDYKTIDNKVVVDLNDSISLELSINTSQYEFELNVGKNNTVNLTTIIAYPEKEEFIAEYNLADNSYVNEFVIIEQDNLEINYQKNVKVMKAATYEASNGFFSDTSIKYDIVVDLDGIEAKSLHNLAVISRMDKIKQFNVTINNNEKRTYGELNNFGVVKDEATLIFNGIGYIKNQATQSQAHQESKIITFDPNVKAQANPYLIIDEADVEASHAAAVGKMDEEQLYYIQSRGIDFESASRLITYGYLKPILNKISDESLKEKLENLIETKVM